MYTIRIYDQRRLHLGPNIEVFSCPEQLNRWPCPLVCLSDWTNNQSLHKPTEWSQTLLTFGTFDQSDEETWPDQKRSTYLHTYIPTFLSTSIREHPKGAIIGTCDIWDNTDNWEPGFMTIFVTWQLIMTLDSIRNSCDVFLNQCWGERKR